MPTTIVTRLITAAALLGLSSVGRADPRAEQITQLFQAYCLDCHDASEATAGLNLATMEVAAIPRDRPWDSTTWEKAVRRLRSRQMPPREATRPSEPEYRQLLEAMESILDEAYLAFPRPGSTDAVRRLNRNEYRNAVRDLLAVEVDVRDLLPADPSGHGFDNVTVGELPPVLLSRYLAAAEKISRMAVGRGGRSPGGVTVRLPADLSQESHVAGLPWGTRGGTHFVHHFPQSGQYEIQLRLMRDRDENVEGLHEPHQIDVLIDRGLVHRFTVAPPKADQGWQKDDTLADAHLKKRFVVAAGPHDVGVTFPRKFSSLSEIRRQPFDANFNRHRHPRRTPALFEVSIVGPFDAQGPGDTPSRRAIFTESPQQGDEPAAARRILQRLLRRAYRRPVTEDDLTVPMQFFAERFPADGFEAAVESALATVLVSPHFLFRAESAPAGQPDGQPYRVGDLQLASRLSFFLWSSIPDEPLLQSAESGRLSQPAELRRQVLRMLRDERSQSLVDNFAAQWLYLRNLDTFQPDRRLFPDFDDNLRRALRQETELLFQHVLREDRSVLELIRTDTTFLNERLAQHYNIPRVYGSHFRPVRLVGQAANRRGGLLSHGSILAVTSYATRTSPTVRGNWILSNVLGTPPPPPPPNVPSLQDEKAAHPLTIRQRLAQHRANPACASCHDLIDPLGFALENFDAVGRWRTTEHGLPIDATGRMPDGRQIAGPQELQQGIMQLPELFVGTLVEKLLTFALGRGAQPYDGPAVRKVVREAADEDYRFSSLILGIVSSTPFQMREG